MIKEITVSELNTGRFIEEWTDEIMRTVGEGTAINALSGGVDSSTVTMLGHRALGKRLRTVFIQNGLMREGEPEKVAGFFRNQSIEVEIVDASEEFLDAVRSITDPEKHCRHNNRGGAGNSKCNL